MGSIQTDDPVGRPLEELSSDSISICIHRFFRRQLFWYTIFRGDAKKIGGILYPARDRVPENPACPSLLQINGIMRSFRMCCRGDDRTAGSIGRLVHFSPFLTYELIIFYTSVQGLKGDRDGRSCALLYLTDLYNDLYNNYRCRSRSMCNNHRYRGHPPLYRTWLWRLL